MSKKFLAVDQFLEVYIEDSEAAVDYAIVNELGIKYYLITVDEFGSPTLTHVDEVSR